MKQEGEFIFNLSNRELNHNEKTLLNKGLAYAPPSPTHLFKLTAETFTIYTSIQLKYFYIKDNVRVYTLTYLVKTSCRVKKSTFCPHVNNARTETFCNLVDKDRENL